MDMSMPPRAFLECSRRDGLCHGGAAALALLLGGTALARPAMAAPGGDFAPPARKSLGATKGWSDYPRMLRRISEPRFPDRDFPITRFGAKPGEDAGEAIAAAIAACAAAGGGRVVVPPGVFPTGPIVLRSHVNLHLSEGSTLQFSTDPARYPTVFTRWEGIECMNFSALISASGQRNIALTGKGTLDGQASAETWWSWKATYFKQPGPDRQREDARALIAMAEAGVPPEKRVFGLGHFLRPNFFQVRGCRDVLVEGVRFERSPMWELHPLLSRNVIVRDVAISSHGPNNDGCDPECCWDVLIEGCEFDTGDDCIAIKSGKNTDGRRVGVSSENIIVRGCRMKAGHGGVVLGSECSGHIRNVFVENCDMDSAELDRVLRFKDNAMRGGILENVFARNLRVGRVSEAILTIDMLYEEGAKGPCKPVVRNVRLDHVTARSTPRVMYIVDFPGAEIDDIAFSDCVFKGVESTEIVACTGTVTFHNVVIEPKNKPASLDTRAEPM
jgi:unsaturated rhamnogalacturonyl hydrolase